jgi:replicative DNA helicase
MRRPRYREDISHALVGHIIATLIQGAVENPEHAIHTNYRHAVDEQALMRELMIVADQIDHRGYEHAAKGSEDAHRT